jgi:hypothetical protein
MTDKFEGGENKYLGNQNISHAHRKIRSRNYNKPALVVNTADQLSYFSSKCFVSLSLHAFLSAYQH